MYDSIKIEKLAHAINNSLPYGGILARIKGEKITDMVDNEEFLNLLTEQGLINFNAKVASSIRSNKNYHEKKQLAAIATENIVNTFINSIPNNLDTYMYIIDYIGVDLATIVSNIANDLNFAKFKSDIMESYFNINMTKEDFYKSDLYYSICNTHKMIMPI